MRIQHNIPAMSSYRNYSNNTSALAKNLEKLSSGYKINRAGDDAAGLAISEKMRAQITGLEVAQKNAKDGISLIQTAEGALTEVHDMLNRMYELAEQSANGTYDNDVDRAQLQKEIESLSTEIDRIADSANFNGIKLLDGSLEEGKVPETSISTTINGASYIPTEGKTFKTLMNMPDATTGVPVAGTNTILEVKGGGDGKAEFEVNLEGLSYGVSAAGDKVTLQIGSSGIAITMSSAGYTAGDFLDKSALAELFVGESIVLDNVTFTAIGASNGVITFKSDNAVTQETNAHYSVGFTSSVTAIAFNGASTSSYQVTFTANTVSGQIDITCTAAGTTTAETVGITSYTANEDMTVSITAMVGGKAITFSATSISVGATAGDIATALNTCNATATLSDGTVVKFRQLFAATADSSGKLTIESKHKGDGAYTTTTTNASYTPNDDIMAGYIVAFTTSGGTWKAEAATGGGATVVATISAAGTVTGAATASGFTTTAVSVQAITSIIGKDGYYVGVQGYESANNKGLGHAGNMNIGGIDVLVAEPGKTNRLANTTFTLTNDMIEDGTKLKIGDKEYIFAVGKDSKFKSMVGKDENVIDLTKFEAKASGSAEMAATLLSKKSDDNTYFTIGHGTDGKVTLQQKEGIKENSDMTTEEKLLSYLGMYKLDPGSNVSVEVTEETTGGKGTPLTLQIGDTAESFNQLKVSVKDCHTDAIGVGDIDIGSQDGAADAMAKIKAAVNYVSDVRGTLGATQNRLDHTINNLSVMQENIQDAESTIRDVDVAKEMMEYTKNNILVQSAQAMLAQANQLPQGVLQLLQ